MKNRDGFGVDVNSVPLSSFLLGGSGLIFNEGQVDMKSLQTPMVLKNDIKNGSRPRSVTAA